VTNNSRYQQTTLRVAKDHCFAHGVYKNMTERVKTWVMAVVVVVLLEAIQARHLAPGPRLLWYFLAVFSVSFVLYWLPPREEGILRGWLVFSFIISLCGALFLVLATR